MHARDTDGYTRQSLSAADQLQSYMSQLATGTTNCTSSVFRTPNLKPHELFVKLTLPRLTDTAFASAISAIETDAAAVASLSVFEASVASVFSAHGTLAPNYLDRIPATVRPFFGSVYSVQAGILSANGFKNPIPAATGTTTSTMTSTTTGTVTSTATSKAAAARETGMGRVGSMAVVGAAGFVGLVAAL